MTLAIDGTAQVVATNGTSSSVSLSTTSTNDVVVVVVYSGTTVTGVTSAHLTFTKRVQYTNAQTLNQEIWWAPAASALTSESITANFTAGGSHTVTAFGVSGANTTTPFDTNVSLPGEEEGFGAPATATISTSNGSDMLIASCFSSAPRTFTPPAGFATVLANTTTNSLSYEVVSSTQTNLAVAYGISTSVAESLLVDAIVAASGGGGFTALFRNTLSGYGSGAGKRQLQG